jgi:hypothetical protein
MVTSAVSGGKLGERPVDLACKLGIEGDILVMCADHSS